MAMANVKTRLDRHSQLVTHLMSGMLNCWTHFHRYTGLLHYSILLYNFVARDRFVNPGKKQVYPGGGMSMWIPLQDQGNVGVGMVSVNTDLAAIIGMQWRTRLLRRKRYTFSPSMGAM